MDRLLSECERVHFQAVLLDNDRDRVGAVANPIVDEPVQPLLAHSDDGPTTLVDHDVGPRILDRQRPAVPPNRPAQPPPRGPRPSRRPPTAPPRPAPPPTRWTARAVYRRMILCPPDPAEATASS